MIRGYQEVSLHAELETAAALLEAAGIPSRVELAAGGVPQAVDGSLRGALRGEIAALLASAPLPGAVVITLTGAEGHERLTLHSDRDAPPDVHR